VSEEARTAVERARARLDRLDYYPRPVITKRVRILTVPWFFRLPRFRHFDGFTAYFLILLRKPPGVTSDDLICHELCHVWQMQHHPFRMPLSFLRYGYKRNPYEAEARRAARETRE
jgi:hypothetical protein